MGISEYTRCLLNIWVHKNTVSGWLNGKKKDNPQKSMLLYIHTTHSARNRETEEIKCRVASLWQWGNNVAPCILWLGPAVSLLCQSGAVSVNVQREIKKWEKHSVLTSQTHSLLEPRPTFILHGLYFPYSLWRLWSSTKEHVISVHIRVAERAGSLCSWPVSCSVEDGPVWAFFFVFQDPADDVLFWAMTTWQLMTLWLLLTSERSN